MLTGEIRSRIDAVWNAPHYKGSFARVITFKTEYAQTLIDDFSNKDKPPHIAISVDMLDTGIDVPEVVNLVFFKLVRSKTKFWQMLGRGTRLCRDLYGPGQHKEFFYVFDYCQNLEYFSQNPETTDGGAGESLGKRLFKTRLELIGELDEKLAAEGTADSAGPVERYHEPGTEADIRSDIGATLQGEVAAMRLENFVVRPHRRAVEKYARPEAWTKLPREALSEIATEIAGLPSEIETDGEEAKRFDLLLLKLELALLRAEPGFERLREQLREIAGLLEEKQSIPMVRDQLALIQDVQSDEWWQDVALPMLERVRRRLRLAVRLIDKAQRKIVYSDFQDEMGDETVVVLPGVNENKDFDKFRAKARAFLRAHQGHAAIAKLRANKALTPVDLTELERMLAESGVGTADDIGRAKTEAEGLGLFVRSLVGLDRSAAQAAFSGFLSGKALGSNQIDFVNLIVEHLTEHGVMDPARLYESPFTDLAPHGPSALFTSAQVVDLMTVLARVRQSAAA